MVNSSGNGRTIVKGRGTRPDGWTAGDYKVCRATREKQDIGFDDVMIYRDRLDRWVSSRNIWNQHAYSIININDDGTVPTMTQWLTSFTETILVQLEDGTSVTRPKYNTFRLNSQGAFGAGHVPDITARFSNDGSVCGTTTNKDGQEVHVISGKLCNRGTKPASSELPASFFYYDENAEDKRGEPICTSYTGFTVERGRCYIVGCELTNEEFARLPGKKVLMVANLDENGHATTVECNDQNNTDTIEIGDCNANIVIDN